VPPVLTGAAFAQDARKRLHCSARAARKEKTGLKLFVPGRLCLFGEHSDWAGGYRRHDPSIEKGYAIICGTDQGIHAEVERHPDALVLSSILAGSGSHRFPMNPETLLKEAQGGGFWSYVAGATRQVIAACPQVGGLRLANDRADLPVKKGLSSSAAISVLTVRAFNRLYGLNLTTREEMELAYRGEITTPSRCGRMDQGCAFGRVPALMTFDGDRLETSELGVKDAFYIVIVDLRAGKDTRRILSTLNRSFLSGADEVRRGLRSLLGPANRAIVGQAVEALREGDARALGRLMTEAQAAFDRFAVPACPEELTAPVLHRVLSLEPLQPLVWGGKGVGSQGDGTAQLLTRGPAEQKRAMEILERDFGLFCLPLVIEPTGAF
jgi:galactokinase